VVTTGEWWRDAVVYEIYVRSFADSNGDGIGDLAGVTSRLPYLVDLGVDAIWLTPFYRSPMNDGGYDVADHRAVDPMFGTMSEFDELLRTAHELGLRVYVDIVPNHTSDEHPWFRAAVADLDAGERDRYIFRTATNDWGSVFGGSAWEPDPAPGATDYYLHLFDKAQPDLNWREPAVHAEFASILRFWFDRGIDGFRIDVAHGLYKDPAFRAGQANAWDQDEVLSVWREWRTISDSYTDRAFVGEVYLYDMDRVAQYVGARRLHQAFNFVVAKTPFEPDAIRALLRKALELFDRIDTSPTWVLSNHDLERHPSRFGGGELGRRRGLAFTALLFGLPGAPYLYQGEELGLEESDVPTDRREDPMWARSDRVGRDGSRTPIPWSGEAPGFGFTAGRDAWMPFDDQATTRNVEAQAADPASILSTYKRLIAVRRQIRPRVTGRASWQESAGPLVVVHQPLEDGRTFVVACNTADEASTLRIPGEAEVLFGTDEAAAARGKELQVPAASTVWLAC
jgi:alpha-glucosidase